MDGDRAPGRALQASRTLGSATFSARLQEPPPTAYAARMQSVERSWVPGWDPTYPAGDVDSSGTVFLTSADGRETIWVIVERTPTTAAYARVVPGVQAGAITVRCEPDGEATVARVTYVLTALSDEAADELERFEADYPAMMAEWERLIAAQLPGA